jgi:hypothetical protein
MELDGVFSDTTWGGLFNSVDMGLLLPAGYLQEEDIPKPVPGLWWRPGYFAS